MSKVETKYCKKCGCELSQDTKGKYCIKCKSEKRSTAGKIIGGVGMLVVATVTFLPKLIKKK